MLQQTAQWDTLIGASNPLHTHRVLFEFQLSFIQTAFPYITDTTHKAAKQKQCNEKQKLMNITQFNNTPTVTLSNNSTFIINIKL